MQSKDLSNLTIKKEEYSVDGNKVTCTLTCKANISEFEKETFYFNQNFIKNVVGLYLPLVKIIYASNAYRDGIVAKYYIVPGGNVRILYFDNEYFNSRNITDKRYRNSKQFNYCKNDVIPMKEMCNASHNMNEFVEYQYLDTFVVTGHANCVESDTFNEETGKMVANANAMIKANTRIAMLLHKIREYMGSNQKLLEESYISLGNQAAEVANNISKL